MFKRFIRTICNKQGLSVIKVKLQKKNIKIRGLVFFLIAYVIIIAP